jgi:hypothetical protein
MKCIVVVLAERRTTNDLFDGFCSFMYVRDRANSEISIKHCYFIYHVVGCQMIISWANITSLKHRVERIKKNRIIKKKMTT